VNGLVGACKRVQATPIARRVAHHARQVAAPLLRGKWQGSALNAAEQLTQSFLHTVDGVLGIDSFVASHGSQRAAFAAGEGGKLIQRVRLRYGVQSRHGLLQVSSRRSITLFSRPP